MDEQAQSLLVTLKKSSATIDAKLAAFNNLKASIRHQRVPESCQGIIFECIRVGISAQTSPTLVATAFSTAGHFIRRLGLQEQPGAIVNAVSKLVPVLQERLGDARENLRNAASQTLSDLWPYAKVEVERVVREGALGGHNARAKEVAMLWVVKMNQTDHLPFKGFVPSLVACLEDSDGGVRETAKSCVVELFRSAPEHAKTDLKKQMAARDVRKTIFSFIVQHLGIGGAEPDLAASTMSAVQDHTLNESVLSEHHAPTETLDPLYVHTQRELEDAFRDMQPAFEGRETEHNWPARDKNITKIRRFILGNAPGDFHVAFLAGIKAMLDGIIKSTNTLRTTMSTNACQLVQELYRTFGSSMDAMTEIMIQNFVKMSANTKAIASKNADQTMEVILSNCSYNHRIMQHIWMSFQEKNMSTRSLAPGWLKVVMKKNAAHKSHVEHQGGLELIEKCLKKGLEDASPKVRETTRSSYWTFAQIWPAQAEKFIAGLDAKARTALEKDANNPNKAALASSVSSTSSARPKITGTNRPSVRDAIAAQRRAALANGLPERPSSAQSTFSTTDVPGPTRPIRPGAQRPPSSLSKTPAESQAPPPNNRTLSGAPVRRPAPKRPEISRPATADPYAVRKGGPAKQTTPTISPHTSPNKTGTSSKPPPSATSRTVGRTPARQAAALTPAIRGKARAETVSRPSPRQQQHSRNNSLPTSPSKDENMTLVMPFGRTVGETTPHSPHIRSALSNVRLRDSVTTVGSEDDTEGFTRVLPDLRNETLERSSPARPTSSGTPSKSSLPHRSPFKSSENVKPGTRLMNRTETPTKSQSPERSRLVDFNDVTSPGAVQVYEDPFVGDELSTSPSKRTKPVLSEIAVNERHSDVEQEQPTDLSQSTRSNEQNIDGSRTPRGHHKTTSTGSILGSNGETGIMQNSAEAMKSKRLLSSAIEKTRAKTLDVHGFRKVQELVKNNQDIWGDDGRKFGELLLALLDYLEAPADSLKITGTPSNSKVQNLKSQVLATIRCMLAMHRREAAPYYGQALCSVLIARRQFDDMSHIASEMEKVVADIAKNGQPTDCMNAVLNLIDGLAISSSNSDSSSPFASSPPSSPRAISDLSPNASRTITMSLNTLSTLLSSTISRKTTIDSTQTKRLGAIAVRLLQDTDPEVRRADLEFCLALHETLGGENGEGFWRAVEGAKESGLNLITYYLARRGKA